MMKIVSSSFFAITMEKDKDKEKDKAKKEVNVKVGELVDLAEPEPEGFFSSYLDVHVSIFLFDMV